MLKTDFKKEIESTLDLIKIDIDKDLANDDIDAALKKIDRGMKSILGLDMMTVNTLAFNNVIELVGKDNQYNSDRYMALGELLYLQGYVYETIHDDSGKVNYYDKSMKSFYAAYCEDNELDEKYRDDIISVLDYLRYYEMNLKDSEAVFKLYEGCRCFDKAEDVLFDMLKQSDKSKDIIYEGIEFYNRLKKLDISILEEGNLPINEINESLIEIEKMINN